MSEGFTIQRRVQFAETDMAGVMHFANYFRIMEEVEHAFWRTLGLSVMTRAGEMEISWPRVSVQCEYAQPVRFEDELHLSFRLVKVGEKSLTYEVEFQCNGERVALGRAIAACCTWVNGTFASVHIPPPIRSRLQEHCPSVNH